MIGCEDRLRNDLHCVEWGVKLYSNLTETIVGRWRAGVRADAEGDDTAISILERGEHRLPFDFALPSHCLPGSFESRVGTVRYYLRVIIDIPYASPPQGLKYFTVIGPNIDCNDEKYAVS